MTYQEALKKLNSYNYLLRTRIVNKETNKSILIGLITVVPADLKWESHHKWENPYDLEYSNFLLYRECRIVFLTKSNTMLFEHNLESYHLSSTDNS
ncbi:hypothetical protein BDD43_3693 [Mucilaginibacter gracilis]|uniref:Uncharacterized protein n=1 Tax=Mucilaginibacter gracilis TaxID=423350 RepID=A0A495J550_9SPHI|nr:hypothetical protein BDD43_3693 [Mucilaginibacter gracilis]